MRMTCFQHPGRFGAAFPPLYGCIGLTLALCLPAPRTHAARPMVTDDARITDAKACQVETWARQDRSTTAYWVLPACNVTGSLELTAGGAITHDDHGSALTDVVLQGKTVLKAMAPNGWGVGLTLGTARRHKVSDPGRSWYATVPASFSFNDERLAVHANLGWVREPAAHDRLTWGIGSETELGRHTWLIAETFGQDQGKPHYQLGLRRWLVPGRAQIDTTYGNRAGRGGDERWFSIGLRLLSLPFLP